MITRRMKRLQKTALVENIKIEIDDPSTNPAKKCSGEEYFSQTLNANNESGFSGTYNILQEMSKSDYEHPAIINGTDECSEAECFSKLENVSSAVNDCAVVGALHNDLENEIHRNFTLEANEFSEMEHFSKCEKRMEYTKCEVIKSRENNYSDSDSDRFSETNGVHTGESSEEECFSQCEKISSLVHECAGTSTTLDEDFENEISHHNFTCEANEFLVEENFSKCEVMPSGESKYSGSDIDRFSEANGVHSDIDELNIDNDLQASSVGTCDENTSTNDKFEPKTCEKNCRKNCWKEIPSDERRNVLDVWHESNFSAKRNFLNKHIIQTNKICNTSNKRAYSRKYYLPVGSDLVEVCKVMFIKTLGKKSDGFITSFFKKFNNNSLDNKDNRGKKLSELRKSLKQSNSISIKNHIETFNPTISHYARENCPNRRYLMSDLSIRKMWNLYLETSETKVKYDTYRKVFKSMNIGFGQPSQDRCCVCVQHELHLKNIIHSEMDGVCDDCLPYEEHKKNYTSARCEYGRDKTQDAPNTAIFTVDMQKVILLPKMEIKSAYFISRLVCFNETFAPIGTGKNLIVLWHEAIGGRKADDVASTFYKIIKNFEENIKHFVFWADNCCSQNKNWLLYTLFSHIVNSDWNIESITMKYLETGHTFMKADSVHGTIGKKLKSTPNIYNFEDLKTLCSSSSNQVIEMDVADFKTIKSGQRPRKQGQNGSISLPFLQNVKVAMFRKGSKSLFYKEKFDDLEFVEVSFLKNDFAFEMSSKENPRGVNSFKKTNIMKSLVPYMPPRKCDFWNNISQNDASADANTHFD